jgi:hypothetical protein
VCSQAPVAAPGAALALRARPSHCLRAR